MESSCNFSLRPGAAGRLLGNNSRVATTEYFNFIQFIHQLVDFSFRQPNVKTNEKCLLKITRGQVRSYLHFLSLISGHKKSLSVRSVMIRKVESKQVIAFEKTLTRKCLVFSLDKGLRLIDCSIDVID